MEREITLHRFIEKVSKKMLDPNHLLHLRIGCIPFSKVEVLRHFREVVAKKFKKLKVVIAPVMSCFENRHVQLFRFFKFFFSYPKRFDLLETLV